MTAIKIRAVNAAERAHPEAGHLAAATASRVANWLYLAATPTLTHYAQSKVIVRMDG